MVQYIPKKSFILKQLITMTILVICILGCTSKEKLNEGFYIKENYIKYNDSITRLDFISNQHFVLLEIKDTTINCWGDFLNNKIKKSLKITDV